MITSEQIRSARAALRWSAAELAGRAGVGVQTIKRFELGIGVPPSRSATLDRVRRALEDAGIEFIGSPEAGPGIRIHRRDGQAGAAAGRGAR
jgi:transcriptional regulator with XRE-family HTH domain